MGMYCDVSTAAPGDVARVVSEPSMLDELRGGANSISLEKAWHGLHFLLSGEVWEGDGPLAFLLAGGEPLGGDEDSPLRWFPPDVTRQIHAALSALSDNQLWSRFDPGEMERLEIYPGIWDEPEDDLKEEYLMYFHNLQQVVAAAAQSGHGLLVAAG